MTGIAVNDAPNATNLSAAETYTEDTPLNLVEIVVSDVDSASVSATLTLSNASGRQPDHRDVGRRDLRPTRGTGVWTASGPVADVNVLLPASVHAGGQLQQQLTIATNVSDGVAAAITGNKSVTGIAVNDAPTRDQPVGGRRLSPRTPR